MKRAVVIGCITVVVAVVYTVIVFIKETEGLLNFTLDMDSGYE